VRGLPAGDRTGLTCQKWSSRVGTLHNTGYLADCLRTIVKVRAQFFTWLPSFLFDLMVIQNFNLHCGNK